MKAGRVTEGSERRFVLLLHTNDELKFGLAKGALESGGIPFTSRGDPALVGVNYKRTPILGDACELQLFVPAEFLGRARESVEAIIGKSDA